MLDAMKRLGEQSSSRLSRRSKERLDGLAEDVLQPKHKLTANRMGCLLRSALTEQGTIGRDHDVGHKFANLVNEMARIENIVLQASYQRGTTLRIIEPNAYRCKGCRVGSCHTNVRSNASRLVKKDVANVVAAPRELTAQLNGERVSGEIMNE